jgi:beta-1,4-mannosyltransferase
MPGGTRRATVVVIGDLGRSPRMLNHARSLAALGWRVTLVGLAGAPLPVDLECHPLVDVRFLTGLAETEPDGADPKAPRGMASRGMELGWQLIRHLPPRTPADVVLVQNPPGIPTLPVGWILSRIGRARLIVDWHNLTSAMLALTRGPADPLVAAVRKVEAWVGRHADANLFVSTAMADRLGREWALSGHVLRDRPSAAFRSLGAGERSSMRQQLLAEFALEGHERDWVIVLSPTSWTADEDFDLLLDAVAIAERRMSGRAASRRLLMLASGRGKLRASFERRSAILGLETIAVRTTWFDPAVYPLAVAAVDAGLSLHRSSSGLDLPMKVVDFLGASVPVIALDFGPCLAEAVRDHWNGLTFTSAETLAGILGEVTAQSSDTLASLLPGAADSGSTRWEESWSAVVPTLLE